MGTVGLPNGTAVFSVITIVALLAANMIVAELAVRYAAGLLSCIAAGGSVLMHRNFGWFVSEHGTGGSEYSVALTILLTIIAVSKFDKTYANE